MLHDNPNAGVRVGKPPYQIDVSDLEYADDAGLLDENADESSERISLISVGLKRDASMVISVAKTKAMRIHKKVRVSATTELEIAALHLRHMCSDCGRDFPTEKGLAIHRTRLIYIIYGIK